MKKLIILGLMCVTLSGCSEKQIEENIIVKEEVPEELLQSYEEEDPAIEATVITPEQEEIEVEVKNNKLYVDNSIDKEKMEEIAKMFMPKIEINEPAPSEPVEEPVVEPSKDLTVEETPEVVESSVAPEVTPGVTTFDNTGWFSKRPDGSILEPMKVTNKVTTIADDGEIVYHELRYDGSEIWNTENWEDRIQSTPNGTTFPYWKDSVTFRGIYNPISRWDNAGQMHNNENWTEIYSLYLDGLLDLEACLWDNECIFNGITIEEIESLVDVGISFNNTSTMVNALDGDVHKAVEMAVQGYHWDSELDMIVLK